MSAHTEHQVITDKEGKPAYAVVPWETYQVLLKSCMIDEDDVLLPHEVVVAVNLHGDSLIKAWREHLGLTQKELAERAGLKPQSIARMEKPDNTPRRDTLKKLADAMGIDVEQLIE